MTRRAGGCALVAVLLLAMLACESDMDRFVQRQKVQINTSLAKGKPHVFIAQSIEDGTRFPAGTLKVSGKLKKKGVAWPKRAIVQIIQRDGGAIVERVQLKVKVKKKGKLKPATFNFPGMDFSKGTDLIVQIKFTKRPVPAGTLFDYTLEFEAAAGATSETTPAAAS